MVTLTGMASGVAIAACGGPVPADLTRFGGHFQLVSEHPITVTLEDGSRFHQPTGRMVAERLWGGPSTGDALDDPA
jgi:hypothetical protein